MCGKNSFRPFCPSCTYCPRPRFVVLAARSAFWYPVGMAHIHRFYISPGVPVGETVTLPEEEAHHALRVVRVQDDDEIALFDGQGREIIGRARRVGKRELEVAVASDHTIPKPAPALGVAMAWVSRDKAAEFLILHGTEIGVDRFIFFEAERSQRPPKAAQKWTRLAVEACKQCGRLWLPEFRVARDLTEALQMAVGACYFGALRPDAPPLSAAFAGGDATIYVGPEGDLTDKEITSALEYGAIPFSLGDTVFRSEIAAFVAATICRHRQGFLGGAR